MVGNERLLEALQKAEDTEAAESVARELLVSLQRSGGGGRSGDSTGAGGGSQSAAASAVKVVAAALAEHYRSADAAERCALCLAAATAGQSAMAAATALRLERAFKGAVCALRQHWREPRVGAAVSRAFTRACTASAITASVFVKEKQAPSALTTALGAAVEADVADAIAALLGLLAALTKHERCATKATVDGTLPSIRAAMAVSARKGRWQVLGLAARVLKNLAKWDGSRSALLGSPDAARMLGELVRLLASSEPSNPAARQQTKRAYRALWLLAESRLPALPTLDASWTARGPPATGEHTALVSAENDFERAIFPEAADLLQPSAEEERERQRQAQDLVHAANALRGGGWADLHAPPPSVLAAPPPARPGLHGDAFHNEGRRLAPAMMLHELRRIVEHDDVHNEVVYHNEDAGGDCSPKPASQAAAAEPASATPPATMLVTPPVPRAIADVAWDDILGDLPLPGDFDASAGAHDGAGIADAAGVEASDARGGWFSDKCQPQQQQQHRRKAASGEGRHQQKQKGSSGGKGASKGDKTGKSAGKADKDAEDEPTYEIAQPAVHASVPPMPTVFPPATRPASAKRVVVPPLSFESRFESGNLKRAMRVHPTEYDLIIAEDLNDPDNHCQWFYFALAGVVPGVSYKFNIVNMGKKDSLFNDGLQPVVCPAYRDAAGAKKGNSTTGWHWRRAGEQVCYYASPYRYRAAPGAAAAAAALRKAAGRKPKRDFGRGGSQPSCGTGLYALTFTLSFARPGEYCGGASGSGSAKLPGDATSYYVAASYPFTYTDTQRYLSAMLSSSRLVGICKRTSLCRTLAGHTCDLLTITDFTSSVAEVAERQYVVISARVHPGETNASWMVKGALDFLLGDSTVACQLRRAYVFKVVPMLNPDGVVAGHQRCSLAGVDLNRCWAGPSRKKHPTIYFIKKMIECIVAARSMPLFCDLHGHSRKQECFFFGCDMDKLKSPSVLVEEDGDSVNGKPYGAGGPGADSRDGGEKAHGFFDDEATNAARVRVLPFLLSRRSAAFSMQLCSFKVQKSKYCTARVVVARELGVSNSYTLEASMGGSHNMHFRTTDLENVGKSLLLALADATASDEQPLLMAVRAEMKRLADDKAHSATHVVTEAEADDDDRGPADDGDNVDAAD